MYLDHVCEVLVYRYQLTPPREVGLLETETLQVFIMRPSIHHGNWWLCFISSVADETSRWNKAIATVCLEQKMSPFHQGTWPTSAHYASCCPLMFHDDCPQTVHAWEMWLGCSEWGLEFPDASLEDILACGDEALQRVLDCVPLVEQAANNMTLRILRSR